MAKFIIKKGRYYLTGLNIQTSSKGMQSMTASYGAIESATRFEKYGETVVIKDCIVSWENNFKKGAPQRVTIKTLSAEEDR